MSEDEATRQRREINMFAAMAQEAFSGPGGTFDAGAFQEAKADEGNLLDAEEAIGDDDGGDDKEEEEAPIDPNRNLFVQQAGQVENSGTFSLKPTPAGISLGKSSNLEAAAAALAEDDGVSRAPQIPEVMNLPQTTIGASNMPFSKMRPRTPMHTQQVYLPRPLFFGSQWPPRIVEQARAIVADAPTPHPPEVRNLLSAVRIYGNGISILPDEGNSTKQDTATPPNPTSYVRVFCPKWSQEEQGEPPLDDNHDGPIITTSDTEAAAAAGSSTQEQTTAAGQASEEQGLPVTVNADLSERDLFSMYAQGGGGEGGGEEDSQGDLSVGSNQNNSNSNGNNHSNSPGKPVLQRDNSSGSITKQLSDRDLFGQWARGESPISSDPRPTPGYGAGGNSIVFSSANDSSSGSVNFFSSTASGTFMNMNLGGNEDDSDDSVVGSELNRKVGVNEHLNAALASLEEDCTSNANGDNAQVPGIEESTEKLTRVPLTPDGGRPLTNHELMNGWTPLFGVDDAPLPTEADLGIHETKDEQQRSREQRRNQAIIENCCPQNLFGPMACPNPSMTPDDNHSWNSRFMTSSQRVGGGTIPTTVATARNNRLGVLPDPTKTPRATGKSPIPNATSPLNNKGPTSPTSPKSAFPFAHKTFDARSRFGWWNLPEEAELDTSFATTNGGDSIETTEANPPLLLPPWEHNASTILVQTRLEPNPEKLQQQNRPLSHLHPATNLAQSLPFLSDRPPSHRYLQVDTQAVGFPALGGEIEPLFCSLAIYHVETVAHSSNDPRMAPIPDLQRCGKVTETLNFDVVSDASIEQRCRDALYPYADSDERLQGTRCGVFPLPSNLSIHNLYAILIVHKVISEGSEFEVYLRPGKSANGVDKDKVDLESLRGRAEKASTRQGQFIMPFAFGVAPLLQVFGADVPMAPSSRAVQIPLFRFSAGQGDRQIIDHIMVMLYPRANHRDSGIGGPARVTNGGTAMLVMRNFGYLGLHSVVHSKSSLARDRLVDFTGEMQIRRRENCDYDKEDLPFAKNEEISADVHVVPEWHKQFIAEPTVHGGRNFQKNEAHSESDVESSRSHLYAQELGPLPLHAAPITRPALPSATSKPHRGKGSSSGDDIEPYYHTTFCNDLLCHPRLLHNCPKGNIVVKVEMREMEWKPEYNAYFAHLPASGPAIHNTRRGPFLVQGAYTSCSARCLDPHFLDEFKMKLPLILSANKERDPSRVISLVFTVYRLSFSSMKKWSRRLRLRGSKKFVRKVDEIAGDMAGESSEETTSNTNCHLIQLACGYLPLALNSSLLANGNHDIKMTYAARKPRREVCEKGQISSSTLILSEIPVAGDGGKFDSDEFFGEDGESVASSPFFVDTASATSASDSIAISETTEDQLLRHLRQKSGVDPIALQVRHFASLRSYQVFSQH
jgi:hypothetical protein